VFATGSVRWGDPRAQLLSGESWEAAKPQALTALRVEEPASVHRASLGRTLDSAWRSLAARLAEAEQVTSAPLAGHQVLRPPFGSYGAKARLARRIVELLPPHRVYATE
jgi:hypothetical protein